MNTDNSDKHGPDVKIHPPIIYAISILSGIVLNNHWPWPMPHNIDGYLYGSIVFGLVILIAIFSILEFHRAKTDVRPDKPDSALITSGPYRYTRNPLYLGLTLIQIAVSLWYSNVWILALVVASVIVITQYAIAREERYLEKLFGQNYLDYKQRVRRWL